MWFRIRFEVGAYRKTVGRWTDNEDRPTRFSTGQSEGQVLRVLYPILETDKRNARVDNGNDRNRQARLW